MSLWKKDKKPGDAYLNRLKNITDGSDEGEELSLSEPSLPTVK